MEDAPLRGETWFYLLVAFRVSDRATENTGYYGFHLPFWDLSFISTDY